VILFEVWINLARVVSGILTEVPLEVAADIVTVGGCFTDRDRTYTGDALRRILARAKASPPPVGHGHL
jgi:hypothetical protein